MNLWEHRPIGSEIWRCAVEGRFVEVVYDNDKNLYYVEFGAFDTWARERVHEEDLDDLIAILKTVQQRNKEMREKP